MNRELNWLRMGMIVLGVALAGVACGDDDDGGGDTTDGGSGEGGSSGGGDSGGGGGGTGGTSTGGGTGGTTPPLPMCDTSIPTTATCGGTECPAATGLAAMTCQVPCCVDDQCGARSAAMGNTTACGLPPVEDPSCPGYQGMLMGMMIDLPGCCTADGICGSISSLRMMCITSSMLLPDLGPGPACGDADAGTEDDGGI